MGYDNQGQPPAAKTQKRSRSKREITKYRRGNAEIRLGDYQTALKDVKKVDAGIFDTPYSLRTHTARHGARGYDREASPVPYEGWLPEDVRDCVTFFQGVIDGWWVTLTDHELAPTWIEEFLRIGLYVFAPISWVAPGRSVRLRGDGPACWNVWIIAARPRHAPYSEWGALSGSYVVPIERSKLWGSKPLALMQHLVRDYTRPGDLIVDPTAGTGTTLIAADMEGRKAIGAERDHTHYNWAATRMEKSWTPRLPGTESAEQRERDQLGFGRDGGK